MNSQPTDISRSLVGTDKGLLAIDESNSICDRRFAKLWIPQTIATRRRYRELIITLAGLGEDISGIILYDETIRQQTDDGASFLEVLRDAGIIAVVKVDAGAKELAGSPGEKISEGLDGLRDRLRAYLKWGRALPSGESSLPSTTSDRAGVLSRQMRLRVMPRYVKKPGSFLWSNPKC